MDRAVRDLIRISRYAAKHPRFVQGGGGNCSVKFAGKMAVKASGCQLEDVSRRRGYVILDSHSPLSSPQRGEGKGTTLAPLAGRGQGEGRPSMESPLHSLLGRYVIHTHPPAVIALVGSKQGRTVWRKIFPEKIYSWIPYASPGQGLYRKVKGKRPSAKCVLFLQNHGVFVSAPSAQECIRLHEQTIRRIEKFFGSPKLSALPKGKFLTPDHAVYTAPGIGKRETQAMVRQALGMMKNKKWQPNWLSQKRVDFILNMEQEKYRRKLHRSRQ